MVNSQKNISENQSYNQINKSQSSIKKSSKIQSKGSNRMTALKHNTNINILRGHKLRNSLDKN